MREQQRENWPGKPGDYDFFVDTLKALAGNFRWHKIHYILADREQSHTLNHCFMRFVWVLSGSLRTTAVFDGADEERTLQAGDCMVCGCDGWSGYQYRNYPENNFTALSVVFPPWFIRIVYNEYRQGEPVQTLYYHTERPVSGIGAALLEVLNLQMREISEVRDGRIVALLRMLIEQLTADMAGELAGAGEVESTTVNRIRHYIDNNFHLPINCSSICDALGINRSYGSQLFHAATGMEMKRYLLEQRMREAADFLRYSTLNLEQIAFQCSYRDVSNFIKVFRRFYGKTPGEYRRNLELPPSASAENYSPKGIKQM